MRNQIEVLFILLIITGLLFVSDSVATTEKRIEKAGDVIFYTNALDTPREKVEYLLYHFDMFMEKEQYQDAKMLVEYILYKNQSD